MSRELRAQMENPRKCRIDLNKYTVHFQVELPRARLSTRQREANLILAYKNELCKEKKKAHKNQCIHMKKSCSWISLRR